VLLCAGCAWSAAAGAAAAGADGAAPTLQSACRPQLDFDGVICDSVGESSLSGLKVRRQHAGSTVAWQHCEHGLA
jgi:hypothetical protein